MDSISGHPRGERSGRGGGWLSAAATRLVGQPAWLPILLVALLARVPGLFDRPLWYDEALAVMLSSRGPAAVIAATVSEEHGVAANVHPPGYFMLLWVWGRVFGTSDWISRLPSIAAGLATVVLVYRLVGAHLGARSGQAAGWMLALAPFQVHYAQEVRMYALLGLLLAGAAGMYFSALRGGGLRRWVGFAVLAAAAQYVHSLACMVLLPLSVIPVIRRKWRWAACTGLSGALALLLYAPWLLQLPAQWARVQRAYWIPPVGAAEPVRTLVMFVGGSPLPAYAIAVALFAALWLLVIGSWALVRGLRQHDQTARKAAALALLTLAPPALMFAVSIWQPIYLDRAMLPAGVAFLCWAAWAMTSRRIPARMRGTGAALLAVSFALGLISHYAYRGFPYAPFPDLIDHLRMQQTPGEVVVHSNKLSAIPAVYYGADLAQVYLPDLPGSASDTLAEATRRALQVERAVDLPSAVAGASGVWFVVFDREVQEYAALGYRQHPALGWLQARYSQQQLVHFGELTVHHFWGAMQAHQPTGSIHMLSSAARAACWVA